MDRVVGENREAERQAVAVKAPHSFPDPLRAGCPAPRALVRPWLPCVPTPGPIPPQRPPVPRFYVSSPQGGWLI